MTVKTWSYVKPSIRRQVIFVNSFAVIVPLSILTLILIYPETIQIHAVSRNNAVYQIFRIALPC